MASTKELFSKGIGYDKYSIAVLEHAINRIHDDIDMYNANIIQFRSNGDYVNLNKATHEISKLHDLESRCRDEIQRYKRTIKYFMQEYSYTKEEVNGIPIPTQRELEADIIADLKADKKEAEAWGAVERDILEQRKTLLEELKAQLKQYIEKYNISYKDQCNILTRELNKQYPYGEHVKVAENLPVSNEAYNKGLIKFVY